MPYAPPGGFHFEVIPADRWADQMLKHWKIAAYNKAANNDGGDVTLEDLEKPGADGQLSSPRSLQACLYLGIDPAELVHRPIDDFLERGLSPALQELKFQFYENTRLEKVGRLKEERKRIISEKNDGGVILGADGRVIGTTSPMKNKFVESKDTMEKEVQRIEVVRRRQQRELEQVAKYEALRQQLAEQNAATMEMEKRRREEQKRAKAAKDKAWQAEMRARELQRAKEEAELEAEAKRMAQERYAREQAKMEADERKAKQAKKEARLREIERAQKQEEFRAQLEKTQEEFREAARERGRKMEARDQERRRNLAILKKIKAEENAEIRRMMEKRHDDALAAWHRMIQKKADDYNAKQAEIKRKMKLKYEIWKKKEAEKKAYLEKKEQERLDTIAEANAIRERRCQELLAKAEEQDRNLHNYMVQKHLDEARRTVEKELIHEAKRQRCEALKRIQALHRRQILEKIEMETQRIRNLLDGKQQMLSKHIQANLNLVIHRQSMIEQMQELSISKKWRQSLSPESREEMDKLKDAQKDHHDHVCAPSVIGMLSQCT
ncbi:hypothetical protein MPTK1_3g06880 [Marchantia polymorpha subsp. ruderalis]|uniref:Uncharacterized protein n=2 Tax=Marchantia polymorpha TaxID=3197 RepID=A0AAF6AY56_MARPO|nr:hypothetical protein MARPO_0006s0156 [Marchantia polymorpha]BBN04690.1 hypothetical protein Mp_3g06880 [Marchantia polymorpha subsp. ruderalis]|eukprot:PTQ48128.1 hypothetical protein MARPO_0006s0156 [Marchantia polymorpha]